MQVQLSYKFVDAQSSLYYLHSKFYTHTHTLTLAHTYMQSLGSGMVQHYTDFGGCQNVFENLMSQKKKQKQQMILTLTPRYLYQMDRTTTVCDHYNVMYYKHNKTQPVLGTLLAGCHSNITIHKCMTVCYSA